MQNKKESSVSYTLEYLDKSASKKSKNETAAVSKPKTDFKLDGSKPYAEEFFNIISSELGIDSKAKEVAEEAPKQKQKKQLNLKAYAEEMANIFKEQEKLKRLEIEAAEKKRIEELARKRIEEEKAERMRIEAAARKRIEEEAARIKLEEEKAEKERIEREAEKIRLEEAALAAAAAQTAQQVLKEDFADETINEVAEPQTNISYYAKKEPPVLTENPVNLQNVVNNGDFVTFKDLQKHYVDFINKIQMQMSSIGGGGEVLLKRLDDLDFDTFSDGFVIKYNQQTGKFYGAQESISAEVLDGGEF